jgi:hypothetical protein
MQQIRPLFKRHGRRSHERRRILDLHRPGALAGMILGSIRHLRHPPLGSPSAPSSPRRDPSARPATGPDLEREIPVLSYVLQRGRCGAAARPSGALLLVELACGLWFALVAWRFGPTGPATVYAASAGWHHRLMH